MSDFVDNKVFGSNEYRLVINLTPMAYDELVNYF